jgi:hypothetical protein
MSNELSSWLKALDRQGFEVEADVVTCGFGLKGMARRHAVRVREVQDGIRMEATVATARTLESMERHEDPHRWAWRRNRASSLVGFRVDHQQRLIAEVVMPKALTQQEFLTYLRAVAAEADRMELVLTGRDVH